MMLERAPRGDVRRAADFFKLIRYSFSGGAKSFAGKSCDIRRFFYLIWECSRRLANVVIENKDCVEVARQYDRPDAFLYGWLNPETLTIDYATNGMPDLGANQMYYSASVSGPIDTMPDTPGLAVWHDGHIGVYIGNGEVIEAMGTKYGVVKTKLEGRGWTHWLEIEYINYN